MSAGNDKQLLKAQEEIQEVTAALAAGKEISVDVWVATALSELNGIFTVEKNKGFLSRTCVFTLFLTTFGSTNREKNLTALNVIDRMFVQSCQVIFFQNWR